MAVWLCSTKSLSHLPVENLFSSNLLCFWGEFECSCLPVVTVKLLHREFVVSSPQDVTQTTNRKQTLPLVFFFCLLFVCFFILDTFCFWALKYPFLASCLWYLPDLGTNTFGALLLLFKLVSGSASLLVLYGLRLHPMSLCFLINVQWKDNFTPELVWICTDGDMGQQVFSLEKAQLASHKSCNVSTRVDRRFIQG